MAVRLSDDPMLTEAAGGNSAESAESSTTTPRDNKGKAKLKRNQKQKSPALQIDKARIHEARSAALEIGSMVAETVVRKLDSAVEKLISVLTGQKCSTEQENAPSPAKRKAEQSTVIEGSQGENDDTSEVEVELAGPEFASEWQPSQEVDMFINLVFTTPQRTKLFDLYPKPLTDAAHVPTLDASIKAMQTLKTPRYIKLREPC